MNFFKNLKNFIREYRIIAISTAFVIGLAASNFILSFINDVFLPMLRPLISSSDTWEEIVVTVGSANIRFGSFLSAFFNLLLVILLVYIFVDKILHWKPKR